MMDPEKILISLSGGPGSLAVAWILRKQGKQIRGVFFDVLGDPAQVKLVESFERKLGISIQIVSAKAEVEQLLIEGMRSSLLEGRRVNLKELFHQKYLLPKLFELKEVFQCHKVATGHRVKVQIDTVDRVAHLYAYDDLSQDEAPLMLALKQKDLMALELPLGGLPPAMVSRIAEELEVKEETGKTDLDWKSFLTTARQSLSKGDRFADVYTVQGMRLGSCPDYVLYTVGDPYDVPDEVGRDYQVLEITPEDRRITVDDPKKRRIQEVHVEDVSWIARADLGYRPLQCQMVWQNRETRTAVVSLLQFEGGRAKAFLSEPLVGVQADIFHGQTVLWVNAGEVLGGARVMRIK
jgi:tRNA-specific 2-thiouridylase